MLYEVITYTHKDSLNKNLRNNTDIYKKWVVNIYFSYRLLIYYTYHTEKELSDQLHTNR